MDSDTVALFVAHDGLADGRFLADEALERVLAERGDKLDGLLLVVLLDVDRHLVEQADLVRARAGVDDLRGLDHALEIADAAVVAVLFALGRLVLKILAEIAEFPRGLHVLKQLRPQLQAAVFDLLLHLFDIDGCQFVMHCFCTSCAGFILLRFFEKVKRILIFPQIVV